MPIFLEIDDDLKEEQILWRYMDLAKFVSMLEQNALWLARADTFKDRHEGRFPEEMRKFIEKAYEGFDDSDPSPMKDADDFQDYLVNNTFVSCWHKNFDENMVMWEIYGRDNNAVAIQTSVGNIKNNIDASSLNGHSLILKSVVYQKSDEITGVLPRNLQNSLNRAESLARTAKKEKIDLFKSDKVESSKTRKSSANEQVT